MQIADKYWDNTMIRWMHFFYHYSYVNSTVNELLYFLRVNNITQVFKIIGEVCFTKTQLQ